MGRQFADDSMTPGPINVTHDKFGNELCADKASHAEATAGEGEWNWDGGQYDDGPSMGGFKSYGASVSAPSGVDKISVDNSRADRGKES